MHYLFWKPIATVDGQAISHSLNLNEIQQKVIIFHSWSGVTFNNLLLIGSECSKNNMITLLEPSYFMKIIELIIKVQ